MVAEWDDCLTRHVGGQVVDRVGKPGTGRRRPQRAHRASPVADERAGHHGQPVQAHRLHHQEEPDHEHQQPPRDQPRPQHGPLAGRERRRDQRCRYRGGIAELDARDDDQGDEQQAGQRRHPEQHWVVGPARRRRVVAVHAALTTPPVEHPQEKHGRGHGGQLHGPHPAGERSGGQRHPVRRQQIGQVGHRQQQARGVGQPHRGHGERDDGDARPAGQREHHGREQHRGGVQVEYSGGGGGEEHAHNEERWVTPAGQAGDPDRDHVEDPRVRGQLRQHDDGTQEEQQREDPPDRRIGVGAREQARRDEDQAEQDKPGRDPVQRGPPECRPPQCRPPQCCPPERRQPALRVAGVSGVRGLVRVGGGHTRHRRTAPSLQRGTASTARRLREEEDERRRACRSQPCRTQGQAGYRNNALKGDTETMSRSAGAGGANGPIQIFVSYSPADERWATWMAWELEAAGYRTMLQAWDFVPGTNFIDFMDRGLSQAAAVVAVLSQHYVNSTYGRLEWQAALRADPANPAGRLVTVRVEDCPLDGLLATITYIDLVGVTDPGQARELLLERVGHALAGRAKQREVSYPHPGKTIVGQVLPAAAPADAAQAASAGPESATHASATHASATRAPAASAVPRARRAPATAPFYPPALPGPTEPRSEVTLLQVAGPRFGRGLAASGERLSAAELQARIWADVTQLAAVGMPRPDLMVVTGDLTESGSLRECDEALAFLTGLRALLGLEPQRVVIVPGGRDITKAACRAYFATCEADDVEPQPPYWPKWRHFASLFGEFYRGLDGPVFDSAQPWSLFALPDLRVAVAGLNSTMAGSHRPEDDYGWIGEAQAAWFAEQLAGFERAGWLRIGVVRHDPAPGAVPAGRDAGTVDRLLGPRLSLLLHGPGPGGDQAEELASGLLVVPAASPGQHQFLRLTPDGLDRWSARHGTGDGPVRLARRWEATGGTFATGRADQGEAEHAGQPEVLAKAAPPPEPDRPASPASLLLDRIAEVCETRHEHAKIRRVEGEMPHLLVTHQEEGFIRQWRIAAHVGEPTREELAAFLRLVHTGQPEPGSELVYEGPQPPRMLREEALRRGVRLRSFIEFQGLLDLRGYVAGQAARVAADPLYPPGLYVPQRFRELDRSSPGVRDDLADELLRQLAADHGRFVLVLGDFGRGKTFALHEVARRIPVELPHLVPLLIELRALDKAHSVDGLVAAHLANHGEDLIDLKAFRYMLRQGRIVLLFDGFDELVTRVTYERAADHLDTLVQAAEGKAKIVVASRTQHFKSHEQVLTALGERVGSLPSRRVFAIEDFTPAQIRAYLIARYDGDEQAADDRLRLLSGIQDLLGLSRNPRMLSFIADLDEGRLRAVAGTAQTVSAAALYAEILRAWLSHEEQRTQHTPGAPVGLKLDDLWRAVTTLAMRLWETGESFLRLAALAEVADTLADLAGGRLSLGQGAHAVGAGSLLVRTDAGLFGFIHASVAEWLVAAEIGRQLTGGAAA